MGNKQKFFSQLQNLYVGAKLDGKGGMANLLQFKCQYFEQIKPLIEAEIKKNFPDSSDNSLPELYEKLYTFFSSYLTDGGSIYFSDTPAYKNVYAKVYFDKEDTALFYKTKDLYYVKSQIMYQSVENLTFNHENKSIGLYFDFDASDYIPTNNNTKEKVLILFTGIKNQKLQFKVIEQSQIISQVTNVTDEQLKDVEEAMLYSIKKSNTQLFEELSSFYAINFTQNDKCRKSMLNFIRANNIETTAEIIHRAINIYKKQNEVDFFIHKNAKGFLTEQFNVFIYNYLSNDMDSLLEQSRLDNIRKIKAIAFVVIDYIAKFEDELKAIWNKPKFVRKSNYVVTLDKLITKGLDISLLINHGGIQAQIQEWQDLGIVGADFNINEITKTHDMFADSKYKYLPFDTKHFDIDVKYAILGLFDNLDEECDGILIKSDNYQSLNTIKIKYQGQIGCIHIDPPYNTDTSGFLYMNSYRHSSWLTMMENRYQFTENLLSNNGSYICHIDENEYENLHLLCNSYNIPSAGTLIWDKRNPLNGGSGLATQHEYVLWRTNQTKPINKRNKNILSILNKADSLIKLYGEVNETVRIEFKRWINENMELSGGEKAYDNIDDNGIVYQSVSLRAPEKRNDLKFHESLLHPVTNKPCPVPPNGFSRSPDTLRIMQQNGDILFGIDETTQPRQKLKLKIGSSRQMSTVIQDAKTGTPILQSLGLDFPYSHPTSIYEELISSVSQNGNEIILDYFAGSGTTAHAIFNLNREDNGNRKYILIEMGEHYTNVILPRVKKIIFSQLWEKSQPRKASDNIKYFRDQLNKKKTELKSTEKYSREEFEIENLHIEMEVKQIENYINKISQLKYQNEYYGVSQIVKYYELEQYEEVLDKAVYNCTDDNVANLAYDFSNNEKLAHDGLAIDYSDESNPIHYSFEKLYPDVDIWETISNFYGYKIKQYHSSKQVTYVTRDGREITLSKDKITFDNMPELKALIWW